jgi:hypothetical protein
MAVSFVLSIHMGSGSLNMARHCKKNGLEPHHAVFTFSATLPIVHHPAAGVIAWKETINRRPLTEEIANYSHSNICCKLLFESCFLK